MSKKYLSLEEAANQLGITSEQLIRHRENGDVRGFADRATWKFRPEDIETLGRSMQADSSPEVPLLSDDDLLPSSTPASLEETSPLIDPLGTSDSDVRLIDDSNPTRDSDSDVALLSDSDSDIRLIDDSPPVSDSDSDVRIASGDSDSEVRLAPPENEDSDSDVQILGGDSDSDIRLIDSDTAADDDSVLTSDSEIDQSDAATIAAGSGILDQAPADSGISLETADSGITLDSAESGITLESPDSGIALEVVDSGISLSDDDDDDAFQLAVDSGIDIDGPADSGIALEGTDQSDNDLYQTIPMIESPVGGDSLDATQIEVPTLGGGESDFEIGAFEEDEDDAEIGEDSSAMLFDDDTSGDAATVVKRTADEDFDLDDEFDELEVDDDGLEGEDDELDVFDADDDDFDDGFATGESQAEFVAPQVGMVAAVEADWGAATFVGLLLSASVMCVCSVVIFDLVQAMWAWNEPAAFNSSLLDTVRGMF